MKSAEIPRNTVEQIRKRPGMYIGDVSLYGVTTIFNELLDNAIDQFLAGRVKNISIGSDGQMLEMRDDGEGFPFDVPDAECGNRMTRFLTQVHPTNTADDHVPHVHRGGLHGIGLAAVNPLCAEATFTTWRGGGRWSQSFTRGRPVSNATFHPSEPGRGVQIRIRLDPDIFADVGFTRGLVRQGAFTAVHLFPGLRIACNGEVFHAPDGLADLGAIIGSGLMLNPLRPLRVRTMVDAVSVDATVFPAFWRSAEKKMLFVSFANGTPTMEDGSHVDGLRQALRSVGWRPALAILHVVMYDVNYAGPTKSKLDSPIAKSAVRRAMTSPMDAFCRLHGLGKHKKSG